MMIFYTGGKTHLCFWWWKQRRVNVNSWCRRWKRISWMGTNYWWREWKVLPLASRKAQQESEYSIRKLGRKGSAWLGHGSHRQQLNASLERQRSLLVWLVCSWANDDVLHFTLPYITRFPLTPMWLVSTILHFHHNSISHMSNTLGTNEKNLPHCFTQNFGGWQLTSIPTNIDKKYQQESIDKVMAQQNSWLNSSSQHQTSMNHTFINIALFAVIDVIILR